MLTLILLVVLGGVVGLLAVSLAESPKPATDDAASRRADAGEAIAPSGSTGRPEPAPNGPVRAPGPPPEPPTAPVTVAAESATAPATTPDLVPPSTGPVRADVLPRRVDRGAVPKAYTAVEGRYQDVIRPPWWRRLVSLGLIAVIVVAVGVSIAAILGAIIGAVAEVLGNTIG